jgi:hypothetical protein
MLKKTVINFAGNVVRASLGTALYWSIDTSARHSHSTSELVIGTLACALLFTAATFGWRRAEGGPVLRRILGTLAYVLPLLALAIVAMVADAAPWVFGQILTPIPLALMAGLALGSIAGWVAARVRHY